MDMDAILTFQAQSRDGTRVSCGPAPVMELGYVNFYLLERLRDEGVAECDVPWLAALLEVHGPLVRELRSFGPEHGLKGLSPVLLVLAARYGYARDEDPLRFLHDLPALVARVVDDEPVAVGEDRDGEASSFAETMTALAEGDRAAQLRDRLADLWQALAPAWEREGRATVAKAAAEFKAAFERTGSVLESLPPHHFTRFEELAHTIREAEERRRVVVVPLHLASTGGFNFVIDDVHYVGYGLQSESDYERTAQRVGALASRVKVLGDPTRLMVLVLVGRFSSMHLTVGDLAEQIGVSQPTVSGHLKLLREAGLVVAERHGNKTYHRVEREALRQLLHELRDTLLD